MLITVDGIKFKVLEKIFVDWKQQENKYYQEDGDSLTKNNYVEYFKIIGETEQGKKVYFKTIEHLKRRPEGGADVDKIEYIRTDKNWEDKPMDKYREIKNGKIIWKDI